MLSTTHITFAAMSNVPTTQDIPLSQTHTQLPQLALPTRVHTDRDTSSYNTDGTLSTSPLPTSG